MRMTRFRFEPQFRPVRADDEWIKRTVEESYSGSDWHSPVPAHKMIEALLYYTGQSDRVGCFKCRLGLGGWNEGDNPFDLHRQYSPNCSFWIHKPRSSPWRTYAVEVHVSSPEHEVSLREENAMLRQRQNQITDRINAEVAEQACREYFSRMHVSEAVAIYRRQNEAWRAFEVSSDVRDVMSTMLTQLEQEDASVAGGSLPEDEEGGASASLPIKNRKRKS